MPQARLMSRPEDARRLEIEPGIIAPWEAGRREAPVEGRGELWHFEAPMQGTQPPEQ